MIGSSKAGEPDRETNAAEGIEDVAEKAGAADASATREPAEATEDAAESSAEPAPSEPSDGVESMAERIEALQAELETREERYLRLAAEFDNFRKRVARERDASRSRARADTVSPLLDVLDDLQRVAEQPSDTTTAEGVIEGAGLVEKKFRHALASLGLETIQAEDEFFNPAVMEALMTVPTAEEADDDSVAEVFQKGYRLGDVLIRPARVSVKKYEADESESGSE